MRLVKTLRLNHFVLIIALFFGISSCKPLHDLGIKNYPVDSLSTNEYRKLNGIYSNMHINIEGKLKYSPYSGMDDLQNLTLLDQLFIKVPEKYYIRANGSQILPEEKWIKIEFTSARKASVSFYRNDTLVNDKKIRGKMKDGYFYIRPKGFVAPLVIVFGYHFQRTRLGRSGEYLLVDYSINNWGFALIGGSSIKGFASAAYKPK